MPGNEQSPFTHPLVTLLLLMAANTPDPAGKLNNLGQAINSMREALTSINAGVESFHSQVVPLFMRPPEDENKESK
ncbi:hypothetical protein [Desulfallas thermosapovorans]|uniref:Uncharacterized protein n=1 Tax=Desulfallas thermosapovorans DSM 6562 TaxID=1121431 RepID=A0A5S4ZP78_9FIRM|nr:hypothetical protein [Desulfallas thermosapovorans]TYO94438.1 hypothetical protein LX24_02422 [Desulfallas thermosapovorans DSM 6562]